MFAKCSSLLIGACLLCSAYSARAAVVGQAAPAAGQPAAAGQNPAPAAMTLGDAVEALGPKIDQLHQVLMGLNLRKWKAPGPVRANTQSDVDSMQRDVGNTLPDLMEKAKGAPGAVAPAFAVFRNVDALYDVLLRVSETATMAGAQPDTSRLEDARSALEDGRSVLGNALLQASTSQDAEVAQLRAAARAAAAAAAVAAPPAKTVVNDGETVTPKSKPRRKKTHPAATGQTPPPQ